MRKKFLIILLTVLVFLSAAVLGVSSVYRVSAVTVNSAIVSEDAQTEEREILAKLEKAYKKDSIFFVDRAKCEKIVAEYPHFRITGFKKSYPNRIIVSVVEDPEVYAVPCADGSGNYYILGGDGMVLGVRASAANRLDGTPNLIIEGMSLVGGKGGMLSGDARFDAVLAFCQKMGETLGDIRQNVLSVKMYDKTPELCIQMAEGIKIYVGEVGVMTAEKAEHAVNEYIALAGNKRLTGCLAVSEKDGKMISAYYDEDVFER